MGRAAARVRSPVEHGWVRTALLGGMFAGIVSNLVLTALRVLIVLVWSLTVWLILGPWRPELALNALSDSWVALKLTAFPFVGPRSFDSGFDAQVVALGLMTRLMFSIFSGALFGFCAHGHSRTVTFALGMLFAIAFWAGSSYYITPPLQESVGRLVEFIPWGLAMAATFLWYQQRFPRRMGRW
jgi:hypothetical protein